MRQLEQLEAQIDSVPELVREFLGYKSAKCRYMIKKAASGCFLEYC